MSGVRQQAKTDVALPLDRGVRHRRSGTRRKRAHDTVAIDDEASRANRPTARERYPTFNH